MNRKREGYRDKIHPAKGRGGFGRNKKSVIIKKIDESQKRGGV